MSRDLVRPGAYTTKPGGTLPPGFVLSWFGTRAYAKESGDAASRCWTVQTGSPEALNKMEDAPKPWFGLMS